MKRIVKSSNEFNDTHELYYQELNRSIDLIINSYDYITETFELGDEEIQTLDDLSVRAMNSIAEYAAYYRDSNPEFEG